MIRQGALYLIQEWLHDKNNENYFKVDFYKSKLNTIQILINTLDIYLELYKYKTFMKKCYRMLS